MRRKAALYLLGVLALLPWVASPACVYYSPVVTRPPTLGDELLSLDTARRDGLLTEAEYQQRRAETIELWKYIGDTPVEAEVGPSLPPPATSSPGVKGSKPEGATP